MEHTQAYHRDNPVPRAAGLVEFEKSLITDDDLFLFNEGTHTHLFRKLGAKSCRFDGQSGVFFAVWAPNAQRVNVIGDFNGWDKSAHVLRPRGESGIWEGFIPGLAKGAHYKFHIVSAFNNYSVDKADPFAFYAEAPPKTASVVWDLDHEWNDATWMASRGERNALDAPISVYEVHLGSWMRVPEENNRRLT
jgi:1,4-alpha-glucan branching enzyme